MRRPVIVHRSGLLTRPGVVTGPTDLDMVAFIIQFAGTYCSSIGQLLPTHSW
jgi:hypothetical protein